MQCNETTGRMMRPVAYIKSDFTSKFGIPRQSGLADLKRDPFLSGISESGSRERAGRILPPLADLGIFPGNPKRMVPDRASAKTGGNTRVGVFATRSPFRPNPIGLSSVQLTGVTLNPQGGPVIHIQGADLLDGTPIYDIKPYIPYADSHPEARGSFATAHRDDHLQVQFPPELLNKVPQSKQKPLIQILALDPRPAYQQDPERIYGFPFAGLEIKFRVEEETLYVCEVNKEERK